MKSVVVLTVVCDGVLEEVHAASCYYEAEVLLVDYLMREHSFDNDGSYQELLDGLNEENYAIELTEVKVE